MKNSDYSDAMKPDTVSLVGNMHPNALTLRLVVFVSTASLLLAAILAPQTTSLEKPTGANQTVQKIDGSFVKPRKFLAWVGTSAARGRLEVLFIEQKSLREQLTEILQEVDDYTWTDEGLANFSIKISRKGKGLETSYSILPKVRAVPDKIKKQWDTEKDSIWLPNFFEGKDPFDGKLVDEKGLPAGGTDKRGATIIPKAKTKVKEDSNEF